MLGGESVEPLETRRAAVANRLLNTRLQAVELERKIREAEEFEERLAEPERAAGQKGARGWGHRRSVAALGGQQDARSARGSGGLAEVCRCLATEDLIVLGKTCRRLKELGGGWDALTEEWTAFDRAYGRYQQAEREARETDAN